MRLSLQWTAPASCPSAAYVRARVQGAIGEADEHHQPVEADARVEQGDDGTWHVTLRTKQGKQAGQRTFDAASCAELADATALIVAMMIVREPAPEAPEQPSPPATKPRPPAPVRATPPPRIEAPPADAAAVVLSPQLALDLGSLPSAALGLGASGGLMWEAVRVELEAIMWPAKQATSADLASAGSDVGLSTAALHGCARPWPGAIRFDGCGGVELGRLRAEGFGVEHPKTEGALWSALFAGALMTWPVGDFALRLQVGAAVPLTRPSVVLEPHGEVHRPSAVVARGAIGVSWIIP